MFAATRYRHAASPVSYSRVYLRSLSTKRAVKMSESVAPSSTTAPSIPKKRTWPGWTHALLNYIRNPDAPENAPYIFKKTDDIIVLKDKYPKAKVHLLVLPRLVQIDTPNDLLPEHIPLLERMHSVAQECANTFMENDASLVFRFGFHSRPSLRQLHMHVISQDFDSPSMKSAKHWNSFASPFFIDYSDMIIRLKTKGLPDIGEEQSELLLNRNPACPRCNKEFGTGAKQISMLKEHYAKCKGQ